MTTRDEPGGGGGNMVPIIAGGIVVGVGILALIYKMSSMGGPSTGAPTPAPASAVEAAPPAEPVEEKKPKKKQEDNARLDCGKSGSLRPCPGKRTIPDCDDE